MDSGSCNSIISDKLAYNLGLKIESSLSTSPLIAASGQQLNVIGKTSITLYVNGLMIVHSFAVVKNLFPSLLVRDDFLRKNSAMINYSNNTVTFYDGLIVLQLQGFNNMNNGVPVSGPRSRVKRAFTVLFVYLDSRKSWYRCVYPSITKDQRQSLNPYRII